MVYDFILFENYFLARNHYKDICIIAEYLKACGYSVAIADVLDESKYCIIKDVHHISFSKKRKLHFLPKNVPFFIRVPWNRFEIFKYNRYLIYVMKELENQYKNLYAGSYWTGMNLSWIKKIPADCICFFWGLRSSRIGQPNRQGFSSTNANNLKDYFFQNKNLKFFVSDEIIRSEFKSIGFEDDRLVIRPERYIRNITPFSHISNKKQCVFLTIGSLRREKQIEIAIRALSLVYNKCIKYIIAGKNNDRKYEAELKNLYLKDSRIERKDYRLSEKEFNTLIDSCDYLILCDKKQLSTVTNGTMNEALLKGKPIIAPNYNPYKYYVEKYGIGLLYDTNDIKSLSDKLVDGLQEGAQSFYVGIARYQQSLLFETIVKDFKRDLSKALS